MARRTVPVLGVACAPSCHPAGTAFLGECPRNATVKPNIYSPVLPVLTILLTLCAPVFSQSPFLAACLSLVLLLGPQCNESDSYSLLHATSLFMFSSCLPDQSNEPYPWLCLLSSFRASCISSQACPAFPNSTDENVIEVRHAPVVQVLQTHAHIEAVLSSAQANQWLWWQCKLTNTAICWNLFKNHTFY